MDRTTAEPEVKWRGRYVEWLTDDSWRFHTCLRCDQPLAAPNEDGYGPECRRRRPLDWRAERRNALAEDRRAYRHQRDIPDGKTVTAKQMRFLRFLAEEAGVEPPRPNTRREAAKAIEQLKASK